MDVVYWIIKSKTHKMLSSLYKTALYKTSRALNALPISIAFSVTNRCNLSCKTCDIWKQQKLQELSLSEYSKIFASVKGRILWLTFDGGEPFLRDDFDQIIIEAYRYVKPIAITIATNGTLPDTISKKVEEIARFCRGTQIIVNLSLDDIEEKHDRIRNTEGVFIKAKETYYKLRCINKDNLCVGINTTVSKFNIDNLPDIINYCISLRPDSYLIELAEEREMFKNIGSSVRPPGGKCINAQDLILNKIAGLKFSKFSILTQLMRKEYYKLIKRSLREEKQIIPCLAGIAFGHIFANGDVWGCSVKERVMGNLREEGYDFRKLWHSKKSGSVRHGLSSCKCYCTSANANYTNMLFSLNMLPKLALGYISWKNGVLKRNS